MFDGTMPDTPENQQAYPQLYNRKPGLGFPIARIGAITSLPPPEFVNRTGRSLSAVNSWQREAGCDR
jgi:hypothetical protein